VVSTHPTAELIFAQLRRMRNAAGMSQDELGKRMHYSSSMVSAVELGQRPLDPAYLTRADEVFDTGGLFMSLLELAKRDREPLWFRPWLEAEREAIQLRCFGATLIPGLLQTPEYARAVFESDRSLTEAEVEEKLASRIERQSILDKDQPPQLVAVIDEAVLNHFVDGYAHVMANQILHLKALAERPNIKVHIVPASAGLHVGLAGPFVLARAADGGWVGFLDNHLDGVVIDNIEQVATLLERWEDVRSEALSRRQSIDLMKELVEPWI
jgi:transcriptional regulator with XRE-family HTH domain